MQRVDRTLIRQELHDDDRAGEGQCDGDVEALDGTESQGEADQEPEDRREQDLAEARQERHGAEGADQFDVELDADQEQQDGDTQFRQQVDLIVRAVSPVSCCISRSS